jgi:hypothetical protein
LRRAAFALLALASAVIAYQWGYLDRRAIAEERFELAPVGWGAVDPEWRTSPIVAVAHSKQGEQSILRLGPFGILDVQDGTYFAHADLLCHVRLCDSSSCDESAVVLRPPAVPRRLQECLVPEGTWRLRRGVAKDQWLVSYSPPEDANGSEDLVAAVLRSPVPLGVRRPADAVLFLLGAAFFALASSLWGVVRALRARPADEVDDTLTGAVLAFVAASVLVLTAWSAARVEPAWDLDARGAARPEDWRSWPLVDMVRGPFEWPDRWFEPFVDAGNEHRDAKLGSLELQSRVNLSRTPPHEVETDTRVCSFDSCVRVAAPPERPDLGRLFVVGLRHQPRERAVGRHICRR